MYEDFLHAINHEMQIPDRARQLCSRNPQLEFESCSGVGFVQLFRALVNVILLLRLYICFYAFCVMSLTCCQ